MKFAFGILALLVLAGCASTWVDPRLNIRGSRIGVECLNDPLGMGPRLENLLNTAESTPILSVPNGGDLVLKVTYRIKKSDAGLYTIVAVKALMLDPRYRSEEARYQWEGKGDSLDEAAQRLVDALVGQ